MSRWGIKGPPEEAHSRVTNPERFLPLQNAALQLVDALERQYAVPRSEGLSKEALSAGIELVQPSIELAPVSAASASIQLSFSAFPGMLLRFGTLCTAAFPSCGCDACDERRTSGSSWLDA
jgi:hypothetical protein